MSLTATASPPADVGLSLSLRALQTRLVVSCGLTAKPAALSSLFPPKIVRQTQSAGSCVPSKAHRERRGAAQQLLAPVLRPKAASLAADRNSHCRKQLSGEPWLLTQVWEGEELAMPAFPLGARPLAPGGRRMWLVARTGDTIGKFREHRWQRFKGVLEMEDEVVLEGSVVTIFELHSFAPAVAYPWRIGPALCSINSNTLCCGGRPLGGVHFVSRGLFGSATLEPERFYGIFYEVDGRFERVSDGGTRRVEPSKQGGQKTRRNFVLEEEEEEEEEEKERHLQTAESPCQRRFGRLGADTWLTVKLPFRQETGSLTPFLAARRMQPMDPRWSPPPFKTYRPNPCRPPSLTVIYRASPVTLPSSEYHIAYLPSPYADTLLERCIVAPIEEIRCPCLKRLGHTIGQRGNSAESVIRRNSRTASSLLGQDGIPVSATIPPNQQGRASFERLRRLIIIAVTSSLSPSSRLPSLASSSLSLLLLLLSQLHLHPFRILHYTLLPLLVCVVVDAVVGVVSLFLLRFPPSTPEYTTAPLPKADRGSFKG
ncbi:hypothetical protein CIHG_09147 [Coccidioides immitis H538.4]|uniref:Uncharacterized protein n=1 Tax=Coccidioides immitis H538.4 TaxID=396776 RepID=A0A0J8S2L0_COCIT|nr:hypothetical protein CIHG_09147 [Coccidioides immitis H538.4]